jgi:hypothetical protein
VSEAVNVSPARICRWYGGRNAALSLRFDDAHPTHIEIAVPELNKRGLIGTFMVNPSSKSYQKYREVWEGQVIAEGHELGDHTMNHHGAKTDREAEQQIGEAAQLLYRLQPQAKQVTFEPGGATLWLQRKPFAVFDAKYHLYDLNSPATHERNVMSCSEVYSSFSADAFRRKLEQVIVDGDWFQPHLHQIDEVGHLRITPPVFRQVLDVAYEHRGEVWQAGINAIQQYEQERKHSRAWAVPDGADAVTVYLTCSTDPGLYTQPLTVEVDLPAGIAAPVVTAASGETVASRVEEADGQRVVRFDVPPIEAGYSVRAPGIGDAYRKTYRLDVAAPGPHPYVLFSSGDVSTLVAKTSDPVARGMWDSIIRDADSYAAEDPNAPASDSGKRHGRRRSGRIRTLSFAYAVTHDVKYANAAIQHLVAFSQEDSWYEENSEMLVTAAAICTMGLAYDWLYDLLTPDQRALIREAMITHGLEPIAQATEKKAWWTHWYRCNWGAVIYGQAGIAAMALLPDEPRAADWVRLSQRKIWLYLQSLGDDGGWGESGTYGAYAWSNAIQFMDAQRHVTGADFFDNPTLRLLPYWLITLREPAGKNYVPFADCNRGNGNTVAVLLRLAREYRDGRAQYLARQMMGGEGGPDTLAFLWYDPTVEPKQLVDLPLDKVFPSLDWAFLRSKWEDPEATLFAMKGGQEDWDHHHHDIGSFALYAYGQPLLVDYFYPHTLWGCESESHNTIVVNGRDQRGHVKVAGARGRPDNRGVVSELVSTPWYARLISDGSPAYEQSDVNSWVREVMYMRHAGAADPPDYFVLFDDVDATRPSRMDWFFHTYGAIDLAKARDSGDLAKVGATITQDDAALDLTLVGPQELRSEVYERTIAESGVDKPFDSVQAVRFVRTWLREPVDHGYLVSVLVPRRATETARQAVTPIREPNILGVAIASGAISDVALFALDAPAMATQGIEAVGRSCFVRRSGGRVVGAALHKGQRISVDGLLIFETDSSGHAVVTASDTAIEATLDLYNPSMVRIHCPKPPVKVTVNGEDQAFDYDPQIRCVTIKHSRPREVRIALQ